MRRILVLFTLVAALVVPAATAHAATTIEKNIPFEATLQECGETITLSGTLIGIFTEQPLGGGGLLLTFHFQPQGVSGTSSSGVPYHATRLTRATTVFVPSGGFTDTSSTASTLSGRRGHRRTM